jgi:dipeptidyl aminopeptidase/acylaminoacyl peptidase
MTTVQKRPIAVDDLYNIVNAEDPRISPDGKWVAYVRVTVDKAGNDYNRTIWVCPVDGGQAVQLTRGGKDSQPRWSPDSTTLAFVSVRDDKPQIYLLPVGAPGGEARALTNMLNGAAAPRWSPDGRHIAFLSSMNADEREREDAGEEEESPRDKLEGKHRKERREEDEKKRHDPYVVWRIPYRAGTAFLGDRFAQIYVIPVAENLEKDEAKPRRLTNLDANYEAVEWSPDGQYLYTARTGDIHADEPWRSSGIYRIALGEGTEELLSDESFANYAPLPSPDGKWIAYGRRPRNVPGETEAIVRLSVMPSSGGEAVDLNMQLDRSVVAYDWSPDGSAIIFSAGDSGDGPIYRVTVGGGEVETMLSGMFETMELTVGPDGSVAYTASTPANPGELYRQSPGNTDIVQLTELNRKFLDEVLVQDVHEMRFRNPQGEELQGWYILPVGYEEGRKYPLALNIHGGPHFMWGPSARTMFHEWQFHAAQGYVVFFCNPRGSEGYGEAFLRALHAAWGDVAFMDIMSGVDELLAKGFVDEARMAITGGSYGGYMTAWVVGHTQRFAAAVSQRGVYNLASFYGTSDIPRLISSEFEVEPWENYELLWEHSPLAYAHRIKTPLLIIHAENDYRVPIEQAEQFFAFVRRSGGTVELVRYPRDGHEMSRSGEPEHRVSRLTRMVDWFDRYCKPEGGSSGDKR